MIDRPMSMDMYLLPREELSADDARRAVGAICTRWPEVSFAQWSSDEFGGVVSFWRADFVSIERTSRIESELPAEVRQVTRGAALVISAKARAWEFAVFVSEHLAAELSAALFDPQQGDLREFEPPTYELEDLRVLFDEMART
jgi:hypothetical protein